MNIAEQLIADVRENVVKGLSFDATFSAPASDPPVERGIAFRDIVSQADAIPLIDDGRLLLIPAIPAALGGGDDPANLVCVPPHVVDLYRFVMSTMLTMFEEGLFDSIDGGSGYHGDSVVASSLRWSATHRDRPGAYEPSIIHLW